MDECSACKKTELLEALKCQRTVVKLILPKTTTYLKPLDICVNALFKKALHAQWEDWFANGEKEYTNRGYCKKPSYQQILNFVEQVGCQHSQQRTFKHTFECCGITAKGKTVKSDQLNSCLQSVFSGLENEEAGDDEEEAEESYLAITTDGGMH